MPVSTLRVRRSTWRRCSNLRCRFKRFDQHHVLRGSGAPGDESPVTAQRDDRPIVDDLRIGLALRRVRLRLGWRQQDVAERAGVSRATYSAIERGHIDRTTVAMLRRLAGVLEIRVELVPRWRGADLDRMIAAGHSRMAEQVGRALSRAGWEARHEVSFSHFGERGVIDIVGWHAGRGAMLIIELKTEIVDVNELLVTMDRRRRLAPVVAASLGFAPRSVSTWVVVAETRTNRRRLAAHRTILRAAFAQDGRAISGWLRRPIGSLAALSFLTDDDDRSTRLRVSGVRRVRASASCTTRTGGS